MRPGAAAWVSGLGKDHPGHCRGRNRAIGGGNTTAPGNKCRGLLYGEASLLKEFPGVHPEEWFQVCLEYRPRTHRNVTGTSSGPAAIPPAPADYPSLSSSSSSPPSLRSSRRRGYPGRPLCPAATCFSWGVSLSITPPRQSDCLPPRPSASEMGLEGVRWRGVLRPLWSALPARAADGATVRQPVYPCPAVCAVDACAEVSRDGRKCRNRLQPDPSSAWSLRLPHSWCYHRRSALADCKESRAE